MNGRLARRISPRFIVAGGIVLTMLGMLPFAFAGDSGSDVLLLCAQYVQGLGFGATMVPIMTIAFASLAKAEVPRASAAFSVVQRVGAPFGVTVIAVLLQGYLATSATAGGAATAGAFGATFWWVFAFCAVPLALAFFLPGIAQHARAAEHDESRASIDAAD